MVEGEVGTDAAIGKISITEDGVINPILEEAFSFNQTQQADDQQIFSMATTVYDSLGIEHTVNFTFEKVPGLNEWIWDATLEYVLDFDIPQVGEIRRLYGTVESPTLQVIVGYRTSREPMLKTFTREHITVQGWYD